MRAITQFRDDHFFLSNFYRSGTGVVMDGHYYQTAEAAFQACKTFLASERKAIRTAGSPTTAKTIGRQVTLRNDWEDIKYEMMWQVLIAKFSNQYLVSKLLDTDDYPLIEGNNWHDNTWGNCFCNRGKCVPQGQNWLGRMLVALRDELKAGRTGQTATRVWFGKV